MKKNNPWLVVLLLLIALVVYVLQKGQFEKRTDGKDFRRDFGKLILTRHAKCRMDCRHIDDSEIREILQRGKINYAKSEPDGKPDPKYALEGKTHDGQQVRIIAAPSSRGMVVITVIDLNQEWQCNCN